MSQQEKEDTGISPNGPRYGSGVLHAPEVPDTVKIKRDEHGGAPDHRKPQIDGIVGRPDFPTSLDKNGYPPR